jgi:23S rRNA (cytosine1962-C5)-methyltransferase
MPYHAHMDLPAQNPTVQLKIERRSNHPWIFQKMVEKPAQKPKPGTVVDIYDRDGVFAGRGFYNGHSRIALRVLTADPDENVDEDFFARKIALAVQLRRDALRLDAVTDAYRVIHSEGDGLSGLVVDRFANTLVVEYFSAGFFKQRDLIKRCLLQHFPEA